MLRVPYVDLGVMYGESIVEMYRVFAEKHFGETNITCSILATIGNKILKSTTNFCTKSTNSLRETSLRQRRAKPSGGFGLVKSITAPRILVNVCTLVRINGVPFCDLPSMVNVV